MEPFNIDWMAIVRFRHQLPQCITSGETDQSITPHTPYAYRRQCSLRLWTGNIQNPVATNQDTLHWFRHGQAARHPDAHYRTIWWYDLSEFWLRTNLCWSSTPRSNLGPDTIPPASVSKLPFGVMHHVLNGDVANGCKDIATDRRFWVGTRTWSSKFRITGAV
jgi:hypothetical protein